MNALLRSAIAVTLLALTFSSLAQEPFDISNRATRTVMVQVENSNDPAVVGQSFSAPVPATYYVQGNTGHIVLSPASHGELRLEGYSPEVTAEFPELDLQIDLTTLEVSSQPQTTWSHIGLHDYFDTTTGIMQHGMSTDAAVGVISPDFTDSLCPDQTYIDQWCNEDGIFCGQTCSPILGLPYDPDTGLVNLVGSETRQTCARCCCGPPLESFTHHGDLLITEMAALSGLPNRPLAVVLVMLIMAFVAGVVLFRMRAAPKYLPCLVAMCALTASTMSSAQEPLDIFNAASRTVMVQLENSADPAVVGQSFGAPVPATYSVQGMTGTLVIPSESHQEWRLEGYPPDAYGSFSPIVIEIDLATLEATSQPSYASIYYFIGAGLVSETYIAQGALGSDVTTGVVSPDHEESYCSSQSYIDDLCSSWFTFCGQTCRPVPGLGVPYVPDTGLVNLVGPETTTQCSRCCCGPHTESFSAMGDLMLTEVIVPMSGLPNRPAAVIPAALALILVAGVVLFRMRSAPD